jgi:hypothetical protein
MILAQSFSLFFVTCVGPNMDRSAIPIYCTKEWKLAPQKYPEAATEVFLVDFDVI